MGCVSLPVRLKVGGAGGRLTRIRGCAPLGGEGRGGGGGRGRLPAAAAAAGAGAVGEAAEL